MKLPIDSIDGFLIAQTKHVASWIVRNLGISNYRIARVGLGLCLLNQIAVVINRFSLFLPSATDIVGIGLAPFIVAMITVSFRACVRAEQNSATSSQVMEMALEYRPWTRVLWVTLAVCILPVALYRRELIHLGYLLQFWSFNLGQLIFLYFVAVGPLPPVKFKLGEFIASLTRKPCPNQ